MANTKTKKKVPTGTIKIDPKVYVKMSEHIVGRGYNIKGFTEMAITEKIANDRQGR